VNRENRGKRPNAAKSKDLAPMEQPIYRIRVKGHLGDGWADWFEGLTIGREKDGITVMVGPIADQAALYGLLVKLRNLCLPLISVNRVTMPSSGSIPTVDDEGSLEEAGDTG
jgi:hypothetical protein